jgi:hypothetical protein
MSLNETNDKLIDTLTGSIDLINISDKKVKKDKKDKPNKINNIRNKGTGAGGKNTNINGGSFEEKTSIEPFLLKNNFQKINMIKQNKYSYYFEHNDNDKKIIYVKQTGFKEYLKEILNIDMKYNMSPDEAFIIHNKDEIHIKIIEKKSQNTEGSVFDKLKTGQFIKNEYEENLKFKSETHKYKFIINYTFCVNLFLQQKFQSSNPKFTTMLKIMKKDNINIFYADDEDYFDNLYKWVCNLN